MFHDSRNGTVEKYKCLFEFKEGEYYNHMNTFGISRIDPPRFGGG